MPDISSAYGGLVVRSTKRMKPSVIRSLLITTRTRAGSAGFAGPEGAGGVEARVTGVRAAAPARLALKSETSSSEPSELRSTSVHGFCSVSSRMRTLVGYA